MPPIDSPEQRKAQRDEAERINQLIRSRRSADEQPVDESNVDAGDATDAVLPRNKKGPSGGSRVKSSDIGFGEDEARASCPKLLANLHSFLTTPTPAPELRALWPQPHDAQNPQPGALARDCVAAPAWR